MVWYWRSLLRYWAMRILLFHMLMNTWSPFFLIGWAIIPHPIMRYIRRIFNIVSCFGTLTGWKGGNRQTMNMHAPWKVVEPADIYFRLLWPLIHYKSVCLWQFPKYFSTFRYYYFFKKKKRRQGYWYYLFRNIQIALVVSLPWATVTLPESRKHEKLHPYSQNRGVHLLSELMKQLFEKGPFVRVTETNGNDNE